MTASDDEPTGNPTPGGRAGAERYELGRRLRALREEITELREVDFERIRRQLDNRLADLRVELREDVRIGLGDVNNELAELLPRVGDIEDQLTRLRRELALGATPTPGPGPDPAAGPDAGTGPGTPEGLPDAPVPADDNEPPETPSAGWDQMDRATAERAWAALAEFVERVLHRQYRLTRLQIPDCWPLHPRMVREIAWLRSTYLEARALEPAEPGAALPWHTRALPIFLLNSSDAVDVRECRPGIHRVTEAEVTEHQYRRDTADREGSPPPPLTHETGHERPHLIPAHFPLRTVRTTNGPRHGENGPKPPSPDELPDLIVGSCHPDYWRDHYFAASAADLAERP